MKFSPFQIAATALLAAAGAPTAALQLYTTGDPSDVAPPTTEALCLAGGGSDDDWAGGWRFMLDRSGGGDVVVIRSDGRRGGYEPFIYDDDGHHDFPPVDSVTTVVIENRGDAHRPEVIDIVRQAELIFFAGGDQWNTIHWIAHTPLAAEVQYALDGRAIPVGGTSAGMAVLGGIDYTGRYPSPDPHKDLVDADDVMRDPTGRVGDLRRGFLEPKRLHNVLTDTHFSERDRQGRLVGFMARATWNWPDVLPIGVKAIAADEGTAACIDDHGFAAAYGAGRVFFLEGRREIERLREGESLHWWAKRHAVKAFVMQAKENGAGSFDLDRWTGVDGRKERWWVDGREPAHPRFGRQAVR